MKIRLLKDFHYLDWHSLEIHKRPEVPAIEQPPHERKSAGNEVRGTTGQELVVDQDSVSETADPEKGSSWFILRETGHRFKIPNEHFSVTEE